MMQAVICSSICDLCDVEKVNTASKMGALIYDTVVYPRVHGALAVA